jgi:hypothetical protein
VPLNGQGPLSPWLRRAIAATFTAAGILLIGFDLRGEFSEVWSQISWLALVASWLVIFNLPRVRASLGYPPKVGVMSASISDILSFIASLVGGIFAVVIVIKNLPYSALSVTIMVILIVAVCSLCGFFAGRVLMRLTRR